MKHELTATRLRKAMSNRGIAQRELSTKSKVSEASISQYYNGSHKPSNISAGKMSEILKVNPMWLMGFDVPMEISRSKENVSLDQYSKLISLFEQLTDANKEKAFSYLKFILSEQKE